MIDAAQVGEGLWVGAAPGVGRDVRGAGFDSLVLAAKEYQPEQGSFQGVRVLRVPLEATGELSLKDALKAWKAAMWVNQERAAGRRVLVTCFSGEHRSALIAGMALRAGPERMTADKVLGTMRAQRGPNALALPGFIDGLSLTA